MRLLATIGRGHGRGSTSSTLDVQSCMGLVLTRLSAFPFCTVTVAVVAVLLIVGVEVGGQNHVQQEEICAVTWPEIRSAFANPRKGWHHSMSAQCWGFASDHEKWIPASVSVASPSSEGAESVSGLGPPCCASTCILRLRAWTVGSRPHLKTLQVSPHMSSLSVRGDLCSRDVRTCGWM